nr:MAG TPA: hypothetical protein [Bacteriophage sp.]DAS02274.1 MAG TPA: hypothetical protein [Caudoviricetes sp.]
MRIHSDSACDLHKQFHVLISYRPYTNVFIKYVKNISIHHNN